jgi:hypothetical protein
MEKRNFIRHPSDIPISIFTEIQLMPAQEPACDVGAGGLAFFSEYGYPLYAAVKIKIELVNPVFEARAKVVWCNRIGNVYEVGVEFTEARDAFRIRMVEQICHIEHYKNEIREKEGRLLNGREAALEWINKFAGSFEVLASAHTEK